MTTDTARPAASTSTARARRTRTSRTRFTVLLVALLAAAVAIAIAVGRGPADPPAAAAGPLVPTGETNAMGMPVVGLPGFADDTATAGGVEVTGARWTLGTVPLNVAVRPFWTLRNTGTDPVTLGEPRPEVREGCCPGPLTLGTRTLAPGQSTTLTFELSMHPGMDGWHDLAVHVPVDSAEGADHLVLEVVGDFRS